MEDAQTETSSDELEVVQMLWIDTGSRIDLESIVVVGGVLEQAVEWIEHLVGQQEEEFSTTVSAYDHISKSGPCDIP